jgi:hypothetical protein
MSKQAEAERERRARVIAADGEFQASQRLTAAAAATMADTPGALQLRLLQTVVDVAAEKNSTLVMPFPVELLRFFEQHDDGARATFASSEDKQPSVLADAVTAAALPAGRSAPPANCDIRADRARVARERRDNWPTPCEAAKDPADRDAAQDPVPTRN